MLSGRVIAFSVVSIVAAIFLLTSLMTDTYANYQISIFFLTLLSVVLAGFFILNKKLLIFEPVFLFSAYYTTVIIAGAYSIVTNFSTNIYVQNVRFTKDIGVLTGYVCMYFFLGYISMLAGYYLIKRRDLEINFELESKSQLSGIVLNIVIVSFLLIGFANFFHNIWTFAGGNLIEYMKNVSTRHREFAISGTTLGYLFAYSAMYVWFFKLIRRNVYWSKSFLIFLFLTILMKASTGRVLGTMFYITSFIGIYYFIEISRKRVLSNAKYYIAGFAIALTGILFYFMRIMSSLSFNNKLGDNIGETFIGLLNRTGYYLIDKGNIPNIGAVLKIIDSWAKDIGYLYGQSLITWASNILPSSLRPEAYQPSVMIKQTWYLHIRGGNLPPTCIGEMYANFGFLGPIIGMFFFGCLCALLYNFIIKSKSYWALVIYIQIALGFIMIYPKGEFDNLTLWDIVPILLLIVVMKIVSTTKISKKRL